MLQTFASISQGSKIVLDFGRRRPCIEGNFVCVTESGSLVLDSERVRRDLLRRAVVTVHFPEP